MNAELLVYSGTRIRDRDEMLCLTDMWRAARSPEGKEPWRWAETEQAKQFVEFIADSLNLVKNEVWISERGRHDGGTWAHWQVALAYAKYLSPEFHAWCNDVVRDHMEQQANALVPGTIGNIVKQELVPVRRDIAEVRLEISEVRDNVTFLAKRVDDIVPRRDFSKEAKQQFDHVIRVRYMGDCPCCRQKMDVGECDHFVGRELNGPEHGWKVCGKCNYRLRVDADYKGRSRKHFEVFQEYRRDLFGTRTNKTKSKGSHTVKTKDQGELF
jgi:hypothetical protein